MNFAVLEMRYAFERDMVHRLGHYPKQASRPPVRGWKSTCVMCDVVFKKKTPNAVTCSPECGRLNKNKKQREWHHIHGATRYAKRRRERANNSGN